MKSLIWITAAVGLGAVLYWLNYRPHVYRYEITIEVDTPEGVRSGSSVREVKWSAQPRSFGNFFTFKQRGEAVAVDLPGGQTLFSPMDNNGYDTVLTGFGAASTGDLKLVLDRANADRKIYTFPSENELRPRRLHLPIMVWFSDLNDPKSVMKVNSEDFEAAFGPGVRLKRITMQMTGKPVTQQIERRLKWLPELRKRRARLNGKTGSIATKELADNLGSGAFKAENKQSSARTAKSLGKCPLSTQADVRRAATAGQTSSNFRAAHSGPITDKAIPASEQIPSQIAMSVPPASYIP